MKRFIVERALPGAGDLTSEELQIISETSCKVVSRSDKPCHWIGSFVTDDKIYCFHIAESGDVAREQARLSRFLASTIAEVKAAGSVSSRRV